MYGIVIPGSPSRWWVLDALSFQALPDQATANLYNSLGVQFLTVTSAQATSLSVDVAKRVAGLPAGGGGSTDLTPVLTAIANLSTLESADEQAILAQLSALPDLTRKNIAAALGG